MENLPKDFVFADIEPMIIMCGDDKWIHPFIKDWYKPDNEDHDDDMYRIYFTNAKGETLYVFFKSFYLTEQVNNYYSQPDWENLPKQAIFNEPFINSQLVYDGVELTLLEDCWGPSTPPNVPFYINNEYIKWIETGLESNQFCFSEFGAKVNEFFMHDAVPSFFSLDCGLTTDGNDWWCDS